MRLACIIACSLLIALTSADFSWAADAPSPTADEADSVDRAAAEAKFAETMRSSVMIGKFTVVDGDKEEIIQQDKYTIDSATKGENGFWIFNARVQYGGKDVKFGMPVKVEWAADTPMITLTNLPIPNLGMYTARVLIYGDLYAGTWSGKDHGGHMYGQIVKQDALAESEPDDEEGDSSDDDAGN